MSSQRESSLTPKAKDLPDRFVNLVEGLVQS